MAIENYDAVTPGGYPTVLRLTPDDAARRGLTDADKTSTRQAARNAARTSDGGSGGDTQRPPLSTTTTDVSAYKVDELKSYLDAAGDEERARIIALENDRGDKARATITGYTPPSS